MVAVCRQREHCSVRTHLWVRRRSGRMGAWLAVHLYHWKYVAVLAPPLAREVRLVHEVTEQMLGRRPEWVGDQMHVISPFVSIERHQ